MSTFGLVTAPAFADDTNNGASNGLVECVPSDGTPAQFSVWSQSGLTPIQHDTTPPADPDGQSGDTNPLNLQMIGGPAVVVGEHVTQEYVAPTAATADTPLQRYSWNPQGPVDEAAPAPVWPTPSQGKWQANTTNYKAGDPLGVVFQESTGNGGNNASWFFWTFTPGTQGDPGQEEISHTDYQFPILTRTYTPGHNPVTCDETDACPAIDGDQPAGTKCDAPGQVKTSRDSTKTDCKADTVTTVFEEQVTTYSFDTELNDWVPVVGPWETVSSVTRPANNKECKPVTEVEGEQDQIDDKDDQDKNKPNPVEVKGAQASAPPKVTPAVSPAAQVPTVVAAGLGESTPAQPGRSPLGLLMVLMGALLAAAAATRRRVRA